MPQCSAFVRSAFTTKVKLGSLYVIVPLKNERQTGHLPSNTRLSAWFSHFAQHVASTGVSRTCKKQCGARGNRRCFAFCEAPAALHRLAPLQGGSLFVLSHALGMLGIMCNMSGQRGEARRGFYPIDYIDFLQIC